MNDRTSEPTNRGGAIVETRVVSASGAAVVDHEIVLAPWASKQLEITATIPRVNRPKDGSKR